MKFLDCEWVSRTIATGPDAERGIVAPLGDPVRFAREYLEHERPFEPMPMPCERWKGQWRDLAFRDLALRRLFVLLDVCYGIENERERAKTIVAASETIRDSVRVVNTLRTLWVMRDHKEAWEDRAKIVGTLMSFAPYDREFAELSLEDRHEMLNKRASI